MEEFSSVGEKELKELLDEEGPPLGLGVLDPHRVLAKLEATGHIVLKCV
jgi:hypothetical protein